MNSPPVSAMASPKRALRQSCNVLEAVDVCDRGCNRNCVIDQTQTLALALALAYLATLFVPGRVELADARGEVGVHAVLDWSVACNRKQRRLQP